jgi:phosphoglycolate phosphatase-like HAD superfamily hydrolase
MIDAILVDLDGTIVDCRERHYACYADLARESGIPAMALDDYWSMKRARRPWSAILGLSAIRTDDRAFAARFIDLVESPKYLALDRPYPSASSALARLRGMSGRLLLVTMRRSLEGVESQLRQWEMLQQFDHVLTRGMSEVAKASLARRALPANAGRVVWIGDTEEDIAAAREVGVVACAVCGGLRDRTWLEAQLPDLMAQDLAEASQLLANPLAVPSCYSGRMQ